MKNKQKLASKYSKTENQILWGLSLLCAVLASLDLLIEKHPHFSIENWLGFYGILGLLSCVSIVLVAKLFRKGILRKEDYYDALND